MFINIDPLEETDVAEPDPVLRQAVRSEKEQLALNEFVCGIRYGTVTLGLDGKGN